MRNCHEILSELCDYLDGDLDSEMCVQLEEHLRSCPHCTSCMTTMRVTISMCREHLHAAIPPEVGWRLERFLEERCFGEECL